MRGPPAASRAAPDFRKLADYLEALASPVRLELLHQLRTPKPVGDIHLRPEEEGTRPERNMSRQAVRKHLAKLEEAGLVNSQRGKREGVTVDEHVVNHQMLFALVEELRRVTSITPTVPLMSAVTMTGGGSAAPKVTAGPRFVVVHGAREGQTFSLDAKTRAADRGWVLGRRRGLAVSLDYDPFVSSEHSEVLVREGRYELLDLRTNKNGTELNWELLPRGGSARLRTGDVVRVGRTLLLFRQD